MQYSEYFLKFCHLVCQFHLKHTIWVFENSVRSKNFGNRSGMTKIIFCFNALVNELMPSQSLSSRCVWNDVQRTHERNTRCKDNDIGYGHSERYSLIETSFVRTVIICVSSISVSAKRYKSNCDCQLGCGWFESCHMLSVLIIEINHLSWCTLSFATHNVHISI